MGLTREQRAARAEWTDTEKKQHRAEQMREYRRGWKIRNREQSNAFEARRQNARYQTDHEYRERVKLRQKLRRYGLTHEQYIEMFARQNGRCAVCREEMMVGRDTCIDHDHVTGKVRELLCNGCNTALGFVREDPERLRALAAYVDRHAESGGDA